jgi:hypothetical protein
LVVRVHLVKLQIVTLIQLSPCLPLRAEFQNGKCLSDLMQKRASLEADSS